MQTVVNSLAVLAFVGVVLLLFASSALLKLVRDQQAALVELRLGARRAGDGSHLSVAAFANDQGRPTFALVVDSRCPVCAERAHRLGALAKQGLPVHLAAISADERCARWFDGSDVAVHIDATLLGQIGVSVTPTLIRYDPTGREEWRRVVGTDADLDGLIGAAGRRDAAAVPWRARIPDGI